MQVAQGHLHYGGALVQAVVVVFLCGGSDCMWWWLYVVVEAVHGGDGHLCVALHGGITV